MCRRQRQPWVRQASPRGLIESGNCLVRGRLQGCCCAPSAGNVAVSGDQDVAWRRFHRNIALAKTVDDWPRNRRIVAAVTTEGGIRVAG